MTVTDPTPEMFEQQRRPRFGTGNPERMDVPLWEWLVRNGRDPYGVRQELGIERDACGVGDPDWCFDRFGRSETELPDGRVIHVAGEHEDSYDPDFCIYNDVVVITPDDSIEIYGYPKEVLPPTDFHTATLLGERILIIGSLGYPEERRAGVTPSYWLDVGSYAIEPAVTTGAAPGWIFRHRARLEESAGRIVIEDGEIYSGPDQHLGDNLELWGLDLESMRWEQLSDRQDWRQYLIHAENPRIPCMFMEATWRNTERVSWEPLRTDVPIPPPEDVQSLSVPHVVLATDDHGCEIEVDGISILVKSEVTDVKLIVRGTLPAATTENLLDDIRAILGRICGHRFVSEAIPPRAR